MSGAPLGHQQDRPPAGQSPRGAALADFRRTWAPRIEGAILALLPPTDEPPAALHAAMHYAMFPGGKRMRPLLTLLGCAISGVDPARALTAAAGIECLHTYSLVHDDLPCMDDDDLRRGRPTCHKVHGEATALLVGDALLTLAFGGVATAGALAVGRLAGAAGSRGMVGGQVADLAAERGATGRSLAQVEWIHDRKTGALITASIAVGLLAGAGDTAVPQGLMRDVEAYGDRIGRAFQIVDDCLDVTGSAAELGKNPLADHARDKLTWPAVVGVDQSLAMARELATQAAAMAPEMVGEVLRWRDLPPAALDGAVPLLQDFAFAAVERRS